MIRILFLALVIQTGTSASRPDPVETGGDGAPPTVTVPSSPNGTCPIMGKPASTRLFVDTDYGRIYVCCKPCVRKILADPEKAWRTAFPVVKPAGNSICPVSGKTLDGTGPSVKLQALEVSLCCADCTTRAVQNSQVVLAKAVDATLTDLGNEKCPVTGEAVTDNAFCVIDGVLVHLSSPECIEQVRSDPRAVLEKARAITPDREAREPAGPGEDSTQRQG